MDSNISIPPPDEFGRKLRANIARRRKSRDSYGYHLPPDKVAQLQVIGQNLPLQFRSILVQIFSETSRYLSSLEASVRGGKSVNEAVDFSRWLQFSGVLSMLELFGDLNPEFVVLRRRAKDLTLDCAKYMKGGRVAASYCQSDIDEIKAEIAALRSFVQPKRNPDDTGTGSGGYLVEL